MIWFDYIGTVVLTVQFVNNELVGCLPPSKFLVLLPPLSDADSEVQEHRRYYGRPILLTATPHFQRVVFSGSQRTAVS